MPITWDDKTTGEITPRAVSPKGQITWDEEEFISSAFPEREEFTQFVSRREPGIDYSTGIRDVGLRAGLSRQDTEEERAQFLNKQFGKDNWFKDHFGAYIVKPEGLDKIKQPHYGLPVAFDEQRNTLMDFADFAGDAPTIAGATVAGLASGGIGALPAIGLVGLGAAGGKGYQETAEALMGENIQSTPETAKMLAEEFAYGATGEAVFRGALRPLGRKLMAPEVKRMTPTARKLAQEALEIGAKPSISQISKPPILGRTQSMMNRIFGDPNAEHNV